LTHRGVFNPMQTLNRKQQRRQYLVRKARALGKQIAGHLLFSVVTMVVVCSLMMLSLLLCSMTVFPYAGYEWNVAASLVACTAVSGFAAFGLDKLIRDAELEEARIPHVASLRPDELPVDEVLLRPTRWPAGNKDTSLLIPARSGDRTAAQYYLRSVSTITYCGSMGFGGSGAEVSNQTDEQEAATLSQPLCP